MTSRRGIAVVAAWTALFAVGCAESPRQEPPKDPAVLKAEQVARGEYLVNITGCNDCHTPWEMGPQGPAPNKALLLSGHPAGLQLPPPPSLPPGPWMWAGSGSMTAFVGPWGVSYAINLTPDQETGLVIDEAVFIKAMRTGLHFGATRPILPPMPWSSLAAMTDDDLKAVYAYLRSIPPIKNAVPAPIIAEAMAPPAGH